MNKQHLYIHIGILAAFISVLVFFASEFNDAYRFLMMAAGGWQVGRWVGDWARSNWPLYNKNGRD